MSSESTTEVADLDPHFDQLLDVVLGLAISAHCLNIELLEPLLDPLKAAE